MRTLLIDNYDSFTYNLYQLLGEVNGQPPIVVRNDADWSQIDLDGSTRSSSRPAPAGPSGPRLRRQRPRDPRQRAAGARRVPGPPGPLPPVRRRGRPRARADARAHLAGPPHRRRPLRGHALAVLGRALPLAGRHDLPDELEATAWTEDGVVMGVRHRELPLWGVQFHPESISSAYGRELLANFRDLALARRGAGRRAGADSAPRRATTCTCASCRVLPDAEAAYRRAVRRRRRTASGWTAAR